MIYVPDHSVGVPEQALPLLPHLGSLAQLGDKVLGGFEIEELQAPLWVPVVR